MAYMFSECSNLKELDLKSFNTSNVSNMTNMFSRCSRLTELDLTNFNTTSVTNMKWMFSMGIVIYQIKLKINFGRECDSLQLHNLSPKKIFTSFNCFF